MEKPKEKKKGNGGYSNSYCYMRTASCKATGIIYLTELKMNLRFLCVNVDLKKKYLKVGEIIQINITHLDRDEREMYLIFFCGGAWALQHGYTLGSYSPSALGSESTSPNHETTRELFP